MNQFTQQVNLIKGLLTELLNLVRQGSVDGRHSSDILKLVKREIFGDYTYELAESFVTAGVLNQMT